MSAWRGLREKMTALIRGRAFEREMEEEFSFHLDKAIERNLAAGMSPKEARREAIRDFGGLERRKEETREARGFGILIDLRRDVMIALRTFRHNPGFSAVAILTLAIGIGATTAIFSVVSGVMLQPLPFEESERLVAIYSRFTPESGYDFPKYPVGSPEYFDYIRQNKTMERVAAVSTETVTMTAGEGDPEHIKAGTITASLLPTLRVEPFIGRNISEEEDLPGAPWVFLISYDLWQRRFGGDPDVLGMSIDIGLSADVIEGGISPGQVIGVMPPGFAFPNSDTDLWYSLQLDPARTWRGGHWFSMVGRLAPGISLGESQAEMETLMEAWAVEYPDHHVGHGLYMFPLLDDYIGDIRPALLVLFGAVGFVLLIACLNVASLLMARGEGRRLEVAVRGALGAGRVRLLKQLLTESMLLSLAGGATGILLARTGVRVLLALESVSLPREELITLDSQVLAFSVAAIILTSLLFGLMPSFQAAGVSIAGTLKDGGRGTTAGRRRLHYRKLLVVTEIAIAITLVTGAGLMVRSFRNLVQVDTGFQTKNLLAVRLSLPSSRYTPDGAFFFYKDLTERIRALPGVENATITSRPPLLYADFDSRIHIDGWLTPEEGGPGVTASSIMISEGFFETMGIGLIRGRLTDERDDVGTMKVAVIDEEMANRYWGDRDPIGEKFWFAMTDGPRHTIVGIVENTRWNGLHIREPTFYFPYEHFVDWGGFFAFDSTVMVRTITDPRELTGPIRNLIRETDPGLPIRSVSTVDEIASSSVADTRFMMTLMALFAGIALLLGIIGIYGVISYNVARCTNEFGIRMTLGARAGEIAGMVVRQALALTLTGVFFGLATSLAASHLISSFLFETSPTDPATYVIVTLFVIAVTLLASLLPALRASRIDPIHSLRIE